MNEHSREILALARVLYESMERLDPGSCGGTNWDGLPDIDVELYACTIEEIINNASLVLRAMSNYNVIIRHPKLSE